LAKIRRNHRIRKRGEQILPKS